VVDLFRIFENQIRDLEDIIKADLSILEIEKDPASRDKLVKEIVDLEEKITQLRQKGGAGG
jgi:hypothetical protein